MTTRRQPTGSSTRARAGVLAAWRRLTSARPGGPGRPTLIACSGGADSCALAVALARAGATERAGLIVAHVVHDLRPEAQALADRDAAKAAADALGLAFVEAAVLVRGRAPDGQGPRNLEAAARSARYDALARLARERGLEFVATAHHADDQLETVLMALIRGAGARGMGGMSVSRRLAGRPPVRLVRPMLACLGVGREACREICRGAGVAWAEDQTNADTSRLRAALRARVVPELLALRPHASERARTGSELVRAAADVVDARVRRALKGVRGRVPRDVLRRLPEIVGGGVIRALVEREAGRRGLDALGSRRLGPIVRAARDESTRTRTFELGRSGARVVVDEYAVVVVTEQSP